MPIDIQPDPAMMDKLRRAAAIKMTPQQRREQMISFIHGGLSHESTLTHADIARFLDRHEGAAA